MRRLDVPSLVGGLVLIGFGTVLLLDRTDTIDLRFGAFAPIACAAVGATRARPRAEPPLLSAAIMASMASSPAPAPGVTPAPLRRDPDRRILGGVCAGLAARLGIDPLVVRIVFVVAATVGGLGVAVYALAWAVVPAARSSGDARTRRPVPRRGSVEVAIGAGLLLFSVLLTLRELGMWFSDALVWPLVLVAAGGALLWRQSAVDEREPAGVAPPVAPPARPDPAKPPPAEIVRERAAIASRTGLGVALVIAAGLVFLQATGALTAARDVVLAVLVAVVVLGVIFAPWIVRLARSLTAERAERIRSQERAEVAAHLHDSVLQTLAMVQRRADDPREVAALARRQERELRTWLSGRPGEGRAETRIASALQDAAEEVEASHGVPVEVVAVGDRDLDPAAEALVAAAREAMTNAAKFGAGSPDRGLRGGVRRPRAGVRARSRARLRPCFGPSGSPRRARVDRGSDGAARRAGPDHQPSRDRHRGGAGAGGGTGRERRRAWCSWTITSSSEPGCAPSSRASWTSWTTRPRSTAPSRRSPPPSPTWCSWTCTCRTGEGSR